MVILSLSNWSGGANRFFAFSRIYKSRVGWPHMRSSSSGFSGNLWTPFVRVKVKPKLQSNFSCP